MAHARLYVKSRRTSIVTGHVSVESIGAAHTTAEYAEGSTLSSLSQQDAVARDLLRKSGLKFDMGDVSKGIGTRLGVRLRGVRKTPTLLDGSGPERMYVGLGEISRYISSNQTVREN